jgi:DNA-binding beta-propeller fold protein YncE
VFVADTSNERIDEFSASGAFIKAWGWGVADGAGHFEICTTACLGQGGLSGGGAGEFASPDGVAVDASGDVFVADYYNSRVDEFSSAGAFIKAWGWGVADGQSQLETCTTTCQFGLGGGGAGQLHGAYGIALDGSGEVFVTDYNNNRIVEFSLAGAFIRAWGWGVTDGAGHLETCTTTCRAGSPGGGAGQLNSPDKVAVDVSADVFVTDYYNARVDEFSSAGAFVKAWG